MIKMDNAQEKIGLGNMNTTVRKNNRNFFLSNSGICGEELLKRR